LDAELEFFDENSWKKTFDGDGFVLGGGSRLVIELLMMDS